MYPSSMSLKRATLERKYIHVMKLPLVFQAILFKLTLKPSLGNCKIDEMGEFRTNKRIIRKSLIIQLKSIEFNSTSFIKIITHLQ